jgi:hypothetical protein
MLSIDVQCANGRMRECANMCANVRLAQWLSDWVNPEIGRRLGEPDVPGQT